jgi:hypothetical protein
MKDRSLFEIDTLYTIISSDSLRIDSDDWRLRVLIELGAAYLGLFGLIRFEYSSKDAISIFITHFNYWQMTETLRQGLIRRLQNEEDRELTTHDSANWSTLLQCVFSDLILLSAVMPRGQALSFTESVVASSPFCNVSKSYL